MGVPRAPARHCATTTERFVVFLNRILLCIGNCALLLTAGCAPPLGDDVGVEQDELGATHWVPIGEPPYCLGARSDDIEGDVHTRSGLDWCERESFACTDVYNYRTGRGGFMNCEYLVYD